MNFYLEFYQLIFLILSTIENSTSVNIIESNIHILFFPGNFILVYDIERICLVVMCIQNFLYQFDSNYWFIEISDFLKFN